MKKALQGIWFLGKYPFLLIWWFGLTSFAFFLFVIGNFQKFQEATLILLLQIQTWLAAGGVILSLYFGFDRRFGFQEFKKIPWPLLILGFLGFFLLLSLGLFVMAMTTSVQF